MKSLFSWKGMSFLSPVEVMAESRMSHGEVKEEQFVFHSTRKFYLHRQTRTNSKNCQLITEKHVLIQRQPLVLPIKPLSCKKR